jgi:hypothetical protein
MVALRLLLVGFGLVCSHLVTSSVLVEVEVFGHRSSAFAPIEGCVRIHHAENEEVDPHSFRLQGHQLETEFLHDSLRSSISIINGVRREERSICSLYRFRLPGVAPGEYTLPPISLLVSGKRYSTEPVPYIITAGTTSEALHLTATVRGAAVLYPGQRAELVYRIVSTRPFDLGSHNLPFCTAEGFRRLGEPKLLRSTQGELLIEEIVQEVQALTPGNYSFPTAFIEGHLYRRDFFGRRIYDHERLRAEAAGMTVEVAAFPDEGRPANFQGALGNLRLSARLLSGDQVMVGDRIQLELLLAGEGVWSTVRAPDLAADTTLTRDFRISDLPPQVHEMETGKRFIVEMRPLKESITAVPSIGFSSFDPTTQSYVSSFSAPLPLTVGALPIGLAAPVESRALPADLQAPDGPGLEARETAIAGCMRLSKGDFDHQSCWWVVWLFPLTGCGFGVQWTFKQRIKRARKRAGCLSGEKLLHQAHVYWAIDRSRALRDLEAALLLRLYEKGHVSDVPVADGLMAAGLQGEVRRYLEQLQSCHYGCSPSAPAELLLKEAETLWLAL